MSTTPSKPGAADALRQTDSAARAIQARELFGQSAVVFIEHRGERYQLRQTRNGKLILTK
jgi:hemin uptake protein HemP